MDQFLSNLSFQFYGFKILFELNFKIKHNPVYLVVLTLELYLLAIAPILQLFDYKIVSVVGVVIHAKLAQWIYILGFNNLESSLGRT